MNNYKAFFLMSAAAIAVSTITAPQFVVAADVCPAGLSKFEFKDSDKNTTFVTAQTITSVCIKGGNNVLTYTSNGSDACYTVTGIGTNTVTVSENWTGSNKGPNCKDMSHAVVYGNGSTPTPTPTPTVTPTPTPTVTPTPTPSVTPSPTPSVTPTPTATPSATPTATPSSTPSPTPTPSSNGSSDNGTGVTSSSTTTPAPAGQVLGATSYAATGTASDFAMAALGVQGVISFIAGTVLHLKRK